ncbi:hypothetical protein [Aliikangiella sp. G2MR2-5]|uniref:hypothetical protein n=1 Tax=Aliikangiella sp. G2MR2-5 TaxID=2788943 RepID=UPI0018A9DC63|nr:hypothetical protein [Aliikangiella sp. G2MR2-5]
MIFFKRQVYQLTLSENDQARLLEIIQMEDEKNEPAKIKTSKKVRNVFLSIFSRFKKAA